MSLPGLDPWIFVTPPPSFVSTRESGQPGILGSLPEVFWKTSRFLLGFSIAGKVACYCQVMMSCHSKNKSSV